MIPICSVVVPSRNNPEGLRLLAWSLFQTVGSESFELLVAVDDDDPMLDVYRSLLPWEQPEFRLFIGVRGSGYIDLARRYSALADEARGYWVWFMDDDAYVLGEAWGEKLATVPEVDSVAYPGQIWLGASFYYRPALYFPIVPSAAWKPGQLIHPVDDCIDRIRRDRGWETYFLPEIAVYHDGRAR